MENLSSLFRLRRAGYVAILLGVVSAGYVFSVPGAVSQTRIPGASSEEDFSPAHLCSRCHLNDMLEWRVSGHSQAGTTCVDCHGPSDGHVLDERNNIKPERVPHGTAIAALCRDCHQEGCIQAKRKDDCQSCHHVHALVDVTKPAEPTGALQKLERESRQYHDAMKQGEDLVAGSKWNAALQRFEKALRIRPAAPTAVNRAAFCRRRLNPVLEGFRIVTDEFDPDTGLPMRVEAPGAGLKMVLIGGGEIDIGEAALPDSRLVHTVLVAPFYLSQFEVTQQQWSKVMGSNPSFYQEGFADHLQMPVESVSWEECRQFIERVNARTPGKGFRLPTEAEWEYALRKGLDGSAELDAVAWYRDNSQFKDSPKEEPPQFSSPRPVGTKRANSLGLYDMRGNVWEWCSSLLRPYPYDPADGREDAQREGLRVLRGGGFADRAHLLAAGLRHGEQPYRKFRWNGLRLARSVPGN